MAAVLHCTEGTCAPGQAPAQAVSGAPPGDLAPTAPLEHHGRLAGVGQAGAGWVVAPGQVPRPAAGPAAGPGRPAAAHAGVTALTATRQTLHWMRHRCRRRLLRSLRHGRPQRAAAQLPPPAAAGAGAAGSAAEQLPAREQQPPRRTATAQSGACWLGGRAGSPAVRSCAPSQTQANSCLPLLAADHSHCPGSGGSRGFACPGLRERGLTAAARPPARA